MRIPIWLLRMLPMWDYICPKCRKRVAQNSDKCIHCGEHYGKPVRVPPQVLKDPKALEEFVHQHVFPKVSESQRQYLTRFFTTLFSDGFESGDFSAWTGTSDSGGRLSVQSSVKHCGTYAAKITAAPSGESPYFYKTITAQAETYVRTYVRFDILPDAQGDWVTIMAVGNAANWYPCYCAVKPMTMDGDIPFWYVKNGYFGGSAYSSTYPSINTWNCVELRVRNGTSGPITLYIDDAQRATVAQSAQYNQDTVRIGAPNTNDGYGVYGVTLTAEYDCIVVADAYIGPEAAGGINIPVAMHHYGHIISKIIRG